MPATPRKWGCKVEPRPRGENYVIPHIALQILNWNSCLTPPSKLRVVPPLPLLPCNCNLQQATSKGGAGGAGRGVLGGSFRVPGPHGPGLEINSTWTYSLPENPNPKSNKVQSAAKCSNNVATTRKR
eukprot:scaffold68734_cov32-Tisochrysis_lutea.AAC.3